MSWTTEARNAAVDAVFAKAPVLPVIVIDRVEDAVPLARALVAGGLPVLEVTLRTAAALEGMRRIAAEVEGAVLGAGTVLAPADLEASAAAGCSFAISPGATQASVAKKPSMVAMLGRIIPAPLAIPVAFTVRPPRVNWQLAALGWVSVVITPSAASSHCAPDATGDCAAWASACGKPAKRRSSGKGSMMTPVENGSTCSCSKPNARATAWHV